MENNPAVKEEVKSKAPQLKKMLAEGDFIKIPKVGDIIVGKIIDIGKSEVRIDIDGLTTGVVRGREFYDESNEHSDLKVGDEVEATVLDLENENGEMELSFRFAGHQRAWSRLAELQTSGEITEVAITDANKGGLIVSLGKVSGFLPVSQLMPEHYPRVPGGDKQKILERLKSYVGSAFSVKVLDINEGEDKLIVSEKAAWEEKQRTVIASYKIGNIVEGAITAVTDFGIFIEFGENLEGLIHISELAWQRIDDPADFIKVGDKVKAQIINIEGSKIFLSMKRLKEDPWREVEQRYKVGDVVKGRVLKVNPFGLFVELDADIHGLAHISELADHPVEDPREIAKPGEVLEFKILSIEPHNHRLGLSRKALLKPAATAAAPKPPAPDPAPTAETNETKPE